MHAELFHRFGFEAAHHLPQLGAAHPCARLHGHSYRVEVTVAGPVDPRTGMILDLRLLQLACAGVTEQLDHRLLNELPGLETPTCEHLARWIWDRLTALPGLAQVQVQETEHTGCRYRGPGC